MEKLNSRGRGGGERMPKYNHINIADQFGNVYCRKLDKVVELSHSHSEYHCSGCPMFAGSAQGNGVECLWFDPRKLQEPYVVKNPVREFQSITIADETTPKVKLTVKDL